MAVTDPVVAPLAAEMLECLDQEIAKVAAPPRYVQLRPGTTVDHLISMADDECCAGLAWVRVVSFVPSSAAFPSQDLLPVKGGTRAWAITLELGAIRCAPTPDADSIPSGDEWSSVFHATMDDAAAMRRAICCFIDASPGRNGRVLPGLWEPIAVEGGCVGGYMTVTIAGPACDCSEAGPASS